MLPNRLTNLSERASLTVPRSIAGWTIVVLPAVAPWQRTLYERAFAEAQRVVKPSLPERDLCGVWN